MERRSFLVCVVATAVLVRLSQAVVWGPRQGGVRSKVEIQPTVLEIPDASGKSLSEAAEKTVNPVNRWMGYLNVHNSYSEYQKPSTRLVLYMCN